MLELGGTVGEPLGCDDEGIQAVKTPVQRVDATINLSAIFPDRIVPRKARPVDNEVAAMISYPNNKDRNVGTVGDLLNS
jgi:hypothetical protein